MICQPCIDAGEHNRRANLTSNKVFATERRNMARICHGHCQAPKTCTCQHVVGQVLKGGSDGNQ